MIKFSDKTNQHYGFKSSNKEDRYVADHGCQTNNMSYQEKYVQSYKTKNSECQTDKNQMNSAKKLNDQSQALLMFLQKHVPTVIGYLQDNIKTRAFSNYKVNWKDDTEINCQLKLRHKEVEEGMAVTSLSWNASSSVIAVSYGRLDHYDCCMHNSYFCTWNVDRRKLDPSKADKCIELNSCVTVVNWHPVHPSVIAGGTFNGELKIWDLNKDEPLQVSTQRKGDCHFEAVSGVRWMMTSGKSQQLFSIGGGGRMFLWDYNQVKGRLAVLNKFCLLSESLPRSIRAKVGSQQLLSLTSCDFNYYDESSFVVGTDGGYLFRCSLLVGESAGDYNSSLPPKSPVVSSSQPHRAPVHSIHFSPHHQDIFMSASCDGTFIIHSFKQMSRLKEIHTGSTSVFHARWSPWKPASVCVAVFEGIMQFYEVSVDQSLPIEEVRVEEGTPLTFVTFNAKRYGLLCVGDAKGNVTVWHLNSNFYEERRADLDNLLKLLSNNFECCIIHASENSVIHGNIIIFIISKQGYTVTYY